MSIMQWLGEGVPALAGFRKIRIQDHERGLAWHDGEFSGIRESGTRWQFDPMRRIRVEVRSRLDPWLSHPDLDVLLASGKLPESEVGRVRIQSQQRGLAWLDGSFFGVLGPGNWAWWKGMVDVVVEVRDILENNGLFDHPKLDAVLSVLEVSKHLDYFVVEPERRQAFYHNGKLADMFGPGRYAYWKAAPGNSFVPVDLRETTMEIAGQEMLTADKLALRMNVSLSHRVADAEKFLTVSADSRQSLYRDAQLILRAAVGGRELDALLEDRDALAGEMQTPLAEKARRYGIEVTAFGVRDIILPGDVKAILSKVVEAKKASEAATITRREETAAMRHQLNTARLLADNPTLMRLREMETVEKVSSGGKLKVVVGENGLADSVSKML